MLTLNQIITIIQGKAENHAQLNTFYFGDPWEFGASSQILYPFCGCVLENSTLNGNIEGLVFKLFFCDAVFKGESNEQEVLSDMKSVAYDIYSQVRDTLTNDYDFDISDSITLEDFTEKFDTEVSGWALTLTINQFYNRDTCQVPTKT